MGKALTALPKIARNGDAAAVAAIVALLEHKDTFTRRLALNELPKISEEGNVVVITAVLARLEDQDSLVRRAVAETLRDGMAAKSDATTKTTVRIGLEKRLEDEDEGVKQIAKIALSFLETC